MKCFKNEYRVIEVLREQDFQIDDILYCQQKVLAEDDNKDTFEAVIEQSCGTGRGCFWTGWRETKWHDVGRG